VTTLMLASVSAMAQGASASDVVPIEQEPSHKLVFENEYVRVFSVEVAPHSETKYHRHDRDYVWVSLGDSDVESVRVGATAVSVKPKDGEAQFTKGGFAHKAVNKSDKPFRNVTVELKSKGVAATCSTENCTRQLTFQQRLVGLERRLLFFGGGEAFSYELNAAGAELKLSHITTHGDTRVLIVPVTQISVAIDAKTPAAMGPGEITWAEGSPEVLVRNDSFSKWVVLKFSGPETQGPSRQEQGARDDKAKGVVVKDGLSKDKL
jgi:beta-alanine degradation protein BauB